MAGVPTDCPGFTALVLFFNSGEDGREYHEKIKQDSRSWCLPTMLIILLKGTCPFVQSSKATIATIANSDPIFNQEDDYFFIFNGVKTKYKTYIRYD